MKFILPFIALVITLPLRAANPSMAQLNFTSNSLVTQISAAGVLVNDGTYTFPAGTTVSNNAPFVIRRDGSFFSGTNTWQDVGSAFYSFNTFTLANSVMFIASNEPPYSRFELGGVDSEDYNYYSFFAANTQTDPSNPDAGFNIQAVGTNWSGLIEFEANPSQNSPPYNNFFDVQTNSVYLLSFNSQGRFFVKYAITNAGTLDVAGLTTLYGGLALQATGLIARTLSPAGNFLFADASNNVALGVGTFAKNTIGFKNVAIGGLTLSSNTSGFYNTAIGDGAMANCTTGIHNVAIGGDALRNTTTGQQNNAQGVDALYLNITGNGNCAIGDGSLLNNSSGSDNTAVGHGALYSNITNNYNVGIGVNAGLTSTNGTYNTFVGSYAATAALQKGNAYKTTVIGAGAYSTKDYQVVLGNDEIVETLLRGNVIVGVGSGTPVQSYSGLVVNNAGAAQVSAKNSSDGVEIGMFSHANGNGYFGTWTSSPLVFRTANSDVGMISTAGNFGINNFAPGGKLDVIGDIRAATMIIATNGFTAYGSSSIPTNTAAFTTVAPSGLHAITLGKGWTNDLNARADMVLSVKYTDAVAGDPALAFTNTVTGEAWTNKFAFGIVGSMTELVTIPDISPNDKGSFTDLSGTGASVTILSANWKLK